MSSKPIRRVAVLGSGVMGAGIAAHVASAGIPVLLLDIVPRDLSEADKGQGAQAASARDRIAAAALAGLAKSKPAAFMSAGAANNVKIGNLEDDLAEAAGCDLIIEAIIEKLDIKRALYEKLDAAAGPDTIVASNTSGLRIADLVAGRSERFRSHFLVLHFFNPPRYMKLLEVVAGAETSPAIALRCERFGREVLGKGIVRAKDSPNFVANRIGAHGMLTAIHAMLEHGLAPEDLDALTGEAMGHPKSATFRTGDVVGIDTLVHVVDNCHAVLTADEDRETFRVPDYVRGMIEKKRLGDKTRGGFYKRSKDGSIETLDPKTGEYRAKGGDAELIKACKGVAKEEDVRKRVAKLVAAPGKTGALAWQILSRSLAYAARRIGEITDDVAAIDDGMRWGYNWELGPFEIWDALGFQATVDRMKAEKIPLPASIDQMIAKGATGFYQDGKVWDLAKGQYVARATDPREATLAQTRRGEAPVLKNGSAVAWDLGDGILGITLTSKANSIDADVIQMLHDGVAKAEQDFRGVVLYNQGEHFSVGANLFAVAMAAGQKQWDQLSKMIDGYQQATQRMKYAQVPVVAAPYGMALGGGLELCLGATAVQAAAETYAGLVEVAVGLIPGGAGTLNLLWRALEGVPAGADVDVYPLVTQVFKNIALAKVATSAQEAIDLGYFRKGDGISFDRARQLHEAKARAIGLAAAGHHPPLPRAYKLPGDSGIATLQMLINTLGDGGYASAHDGLIASKLAVVLCGGRGGHTHEVTEQEILDLEREAFLSLLGEAKTQERMQYMLMNNKPLRN
jgi:3-hydroxyacyl-CoA dehydrogenase